MVSGSLALLIGIRILSFGLFRLADIIAIVLGLVAIVLGSLGLRRNANKGLARGGAFLGVVSMIIPIAIAILFRILISSISWF